MEVNHWVRLFPQAFSLTPNPGRTFIILISIYNQHSSCRVLKANASLSVLSFETGERFTRETDLRCTSSLQK